MIGQSKKELWKRTTILSFFLLAVFLFSTPLSTQAEATWPLKQSQTENILDIIRKGPLTEANFNLFFQSIGSSNNYYAQATGAVAIVKQAILKKQINYWFSEQPKALSQKFLSLLIKVVPAVYSGDIAKLIGIVEDFTVEAAVNYATDWLLASQLKIASGKITYPLTSFNNKEQIFSLQYILVYNPNYNSNGNLIAEFYSNDYFEPPLGTGPNALGSNNDHEKTLPWPWDIWLSNQKKLGEDTLFPPFILRVKGNLSLNQWNDFVWDATWPSPTVEVDFNSPVPEISESEAILSRSEKEMKSNFIKEKIIKPILAKLGLPSELSWDMLKDIPEKTQDKIAKLIVDAKKLVEKIANFFKDDTQSYILSGLPSKINQIQENLLDLTKLNQTAEQLNQKIVDAGNNPTQQQEAFNQATDLIEQLDNLAEKADILLAQAKAMLPETSSAPENTIILASQNQTNDSREENSATSTETIDDDTDESQDNEATNETSTSTSQTNWCDLSLGGYPQRGKVLINEVAWMGTTVSSADEWIELANIYPSPINIKGWQLQDKDGQIKIVFSDITIAKYGFLLLERTNDESAPGATADIIYSGGLANTDETLYLFDENCRLQDKAQANPSWLAGNNTTKKTMERRQDQTWQTSSEANGTPGRENSQGEMFIATSGSSSGSSSNASSNNSSVNNDNSNQAQSSSNATSSQQTSTSTSQSIATSTNDTNASSTTNIATSTPSTNLDYSQLLITELQINNEEFVELFNPTNQAIPLNNLFLSYFSSSKNWTEPYRNWQFPSTSTIPANSYYLVGIYGFSETNGNPNSDWQIKAASTNQPYNSGQLNNTNGALGLFSCDISQTTSTDIAQACLIDLVNWGSTIVSQGQPAPTPNSGESLERKKLSNSNYQDTNSSFDDFIIISLPSPINSQNQTFQIPALSPITTLTAGPSAERMAVELFWLHNIAAKEYIIEYSEKDSQTSSTTINLPAGSASEKVKTITIDNLDSQKTYQFTLKSINDKAIVSQSSNIAFASPYPGFSANPDNTITDLYTNLIWATDAASPACDNGATTTQQLAGAFINQFLNTPATSTAPLLGNGETDWRLPDIKELATIIDFSKTASPLVNNQFSNIASAEYWGSSYKTGFTYLNKTYGQVVDFTGGAITYLDLSQNNSAYFLPMRGPEQGQESIIPPAPFIEGGADIALMCDKECVDNVDGTLTEPCDNLMWIKSGTNALLPPRETVMGGAPGNTSWENGLIFCATLVLCNDNALLYETEANPTPCDAHNGVKYNDWRMPNILENIISGTNKKCPMIFPWASNYNSYYWSSTKNPLNESQAFSSEQGTILSTATSNKTGKLYLQCIRSIEN